MSYEIQWRYSDGHPWSGLEHDSTISPVQSEYATEAEAKTDLDVYLRYRFVGVVGLSYMTSPHYRIFRKEVVAAPPRRTAWAKILDDD